MASVAVVRRASGQHTPEQMLASVSSSSWKPVAMRLPGTFSGGLKQQAQKFVFIL